MSSLMGNHGVALATATAMALSGTAILVALCRQRPLSPTPDLRPCIASGGRKVERRNGQKQKQKKRVRFGEDVVVEFHDGNGEEEEPEEISDVKIARNARRDANKHRVREMPENRAALYNGIMQARRMACY